MPKPHFVEHINKLLILLTEDFREIECAFHAAFPAIGIKGKLDLASRDWRELEEVSRQNELNDVNKRCTCIKSIYLDASKRLGVPANDASDCLEFVEEITVKHRNLEQK